MSVVGINNMSKEGERRRYLSLEIRMKMYDDVQKLHKKGLKYKEIQRKIFEKYGKQLSLSRIYDWINRKHHPFGKVNKFNDRPSVELSYVIGVILGDGCRYFYKGKGKKHSLILSVNDKEFAEEFGKCSAKILGRNRPYKPYWNKAQKQWVIEVCSILLYKFLNKSLEELKPYIEYSKDTVSAFLRALFDGEGSIYIKRKPSCRILELCNTNVKLLIYVKYLLKTYFDIDTTGPHLNTRKGKVVHFPNRKVCKATRDQCYLYVRARSLLNFYKYIGFTIKRKQKRLIKAIKK